MKILAGKGISPGLADGHAVIHSTTLLNKRVAARPVQDVEAELIRFQRAVQHARDDLELLQQRVHGELGASEAEIFSAHYSMLSDPGLMDDIRERIRDDRINAAEAIQQSVGAYAEKLLEADDPYLRQREQDIRDIGQRLISCLHGRRTSHFSRLQKDSVIVAHELMPSDLVELDHQHLAGVVTERCGETSHVAILARALGIPVLSGFPDIVAQIGTGQRLLLDGDSGELVIDPSFVRLQQYRRRRASYDERARRVLDDASLPCVTSDGRAVSILANLARPNEEELQAAAELGGVGLLRTEFLFLDHTSPPTISEQRSLYERVAQRIPGQTTIRTLDLGGDKFPLFLERDRELNPNMGSRGLRFSLTAGEQLFRDQICALLQTSTCYPIQIMFPMVMGIDDLSMARTMVQEIADEIGVETLPPLGVLIETPASVLMIDAIVEQADFIGIGTNDLTQFILASDRNALDTADDYSILHPGVLRAVHSIIRTANDNHVPVTICGEAASIPEIACLFVGMGIQRLSMSPVSAPGVKYALRAMQSDYLEKLGQQVLAARTRAEIAEIIRPMQSDYRNKVLESRSAL